MIRPSSKQNEGNHALCGICGIGHNGIGSWAETWADVRGDAGAGEDDTASTVLGESYVETIVTSEETGPATAEASIDVWIVDTHQA